MKNLTLLFSCFFICSGIQSQTQVTFYTTEGDFVLELEDELTPITAGNFLSLVNDEFYDGIIFHRIIEDFIVQGGAPLGTGFGGPGYEIEDEFHPLLDNVEGTISMANSGPNTGGSQFFFNMVNNTFLDYDQMPLDSQHPVFGKVISGYDVLETIQEVAVDANDSPIEDVVMDSLRMTFNGPLGIEKLGKNSLEVSVFPNPTEEILNISITDVTVHDVHVELMDITGKKVLSKTASTNSLSKIDLSLIQKGIYFLRIHDAREEILSKRVIIE